MGAYTWSGVIPRRAKRLNVLKLENEQTKGTMKYHSPMKRNVPLIYTTTWMSLENIMLCEKQRQTGRTTYCITPCMWNFQKGQIYRDRKQISSCPEPGNGCVLESGRV